MKTIMKRINSKIVFAGMWGIMLLMVGCNVNAMGVESDEGIDERPWMTMSTNTYGCDKLKYGIKVEGCPGTGLALTNQIVNPRETDERYVDITMHSGDYGHFETESGDKTELVVEYFRGDAFAELIEPVADNPNYVFMGWSTEPEATEVNISVGATTVSAIGSDVYAVWGDKAYVHYYIYSGVWSPEGSEDEYSSVLMEYNANANFQPLTPDPRSIERFYDFDGWYTGMFGGGEQYTTETVLNKPEVDVYSKWVYNPDRIDDELELNEMDNVTVGVSFPVYKFTPTETAYYEVYTDGIEDDGSGNQALVRIQDEDDHTLVIESPFIPDNPRGNMHAFCEMEAGKTYYVRFGEIAGKYMNFDVGVRKSEMATVTFHGNHGNDVWFDGTPGVMEKAIELPIGINIARYLDMEMEYDGTAISFIGWALEQDSEQYHNSLVVTGDMDVYGFWDEFGTFYLDFKDGYDPLRGEDVKGTVYRFYEGQTFATPNDPKVDDPHLKFVGWSRNPEATEPDEDIVEGVTLAETFEGQTLYAVYGDKLFVTYIVTDGGYMMDDPTITSYQTSLAENHIFYGMSVMHDNPKMRAIGWMDQDGVMVNTVSEFDPYYHVTKDTTFTVVWGYELTSYAIRGSFEKTGSQVARVRLPFNTGDGTFSAQAIIDAVGEPIPYEANTYFIGWATDPDLEEPDIVDGVTRLEDLSEIFAVWGEDSYAFAEGENATYTKGSSEGLRMVIEREHDNRYTYPYFRTIMIDGEEVETGNYDASEGSLILTLHSDYLDSLELGGHEVVLRFQGESMSTLDVNTVLTIAEEEIVVPDTSGESEGDASGSSDSSIVNAPDTGMNINDGGVGVTGAGVISVAIAIIVMVGVGMICRAALHKILP